MADALEEVEAKIADQAGKHGELMLLARLKFLQREPRDELLATQIIDLEKRLGISAHRTFSPDGSSGANAGQSVEAAHGGGGGAAPSP